MPNTKQAKKRTKQSLKKRLQNKTKKSEVKTYIKKINRAIQNKDIQLINSLYSVTISKIDKLSKKNIIHKNKAIRKKNNIISKIKLIKRLQS